MSSPSPSSEKTTTVQDIRGGRGAQTPTIWAIGPIQPPSFEKRPMDPWTFWGASRLRIGPDGTTLVLEWSDWLEPGRLGILFQSVILNPELGLRVRPCHPQVKVVSSDPSGILSLAHLLNGGRPRGVGNDHTLRRPTNQEPSRRGSGLLRVQGPNQPLNFCRVRSPSSSGPFRV